jgi:hypothetical protein
MLAARRGQGQPARAREDRRVTGARTGDSVAAARRTVSGFGVELVAAACVALLYLPSVGFPFVFDDVALIGPDGVAQALGGTLPYRPVRYASYLVDSWLGGSPRIYHAHNLLLHALVAALVARVAQRRGC